MKKILIVLAVVIAISVAYGVYVLPERLDNFQLLQTAKSHELLGYDLVSDRYQVTDPKIKTLDDVLKNLKFTAWDSRHDEPDAITLKKQLFKWPMRYDYTLKISRSSDSKPNPAIELWYVIDGSLIWFNKEQPAPPQP